MMAFPNASRWTVVAALAGLAWFTPVFAQAQAPGSRGITIDFKSVKCGDEDDPLSHDEPYLIVTKFRFKMELAGTSPRMVPGTLRVENVMTGHGSLGNKRDSFTRERRTWNIPRTVPHLAQEVVPPNEKGWVVGAAVTYMEKDGFSAANARFLSSKVRDLVQGSITTMSFTEADTRRLTDQMMKKVTSDLSRSFKKLHIGGMISGIASAVDPDDYGGTALIVTVTGDSGKVFYSVGMPSDNVASVLAGVREISGPTAFSLRFPMGDLSKVPSNARFQGRSTVNGEIRIWRLEAPF